MLLIASVMTDQRQDLTAEPARSRRGGPRRGFLEAALAAFPEEVRGAFQELGLGLLETSFVLFRKLGRTASPRAVLEGIARDLDSLKDFAQLAERTGEGRIRRTAGRTVSRLRRLARELRSELAAAEDQP